MDLQQMTDTLRDSATVSEDLMGAAEAMLVSIVGRVACWLTPLPSAVLVSRAAGRVFELDGWWSTVIAVVLELVGLVTSNLWLTAKEWNSTKRKSDPLANERLALGLMVSYFVTAFLLLLAVELPAVLDTGDIAGLTALLFPGLSAVGIIALNERVTHYRRVAEVESVKAERKARRKAKRKSTRKATSENASNNGKSYANLDALQAGRKSKRDARMDNLLTFYSDNPDTGATEAGRAIGVSRQTIYNYNADLERAGRLRRDGDGWEVTV